MASASGMPSLILYFARVLIPEARGDAPHMRSARHSISMTLKKSGMSAWTSVSGRRS